MAQRCFNVPIQNKRTLRRFQQTLLNSFLDSQIQNLVLIMIYFTPPRVVHANSNSRENFEETTRVASLRSLPCRVASIGSLPWRVASLISLLLNRIPKTLIFKNGWYYKLVTHKVWVINYNSWRLKKVLVRVNNGLKLLITKGSSGNDRFNHVTTPPRDCSTMYFQLR